MSKGLPPFPDGWYCVALSRELGPNAVLPRRVMGRELVLWRAGAGEAVLSDAYCPHLGANLGRGGCVEDGALRCPFHHFRFDATGACVSTPYGKKVPPKARLAGFPVRELGGFVIAYFAADGRAPSWEPLLPDAGGALLTHAFDLRSHPQETTENSVDLGHLSVVHGYRSVESLAPLHTEGALLKARYAFERPRGLFTDGGRPIRAEIDITAWGLGWSVVDVSLPDLGMRTRQFVLATPVDGERIVLRIALSLESLERPSLVHPLLTLLPRPLARRLVRSLAFRGFKADVSQDFEIWEHKTYVQPPVLADGDGPVGPYRRWAKQFYQESNRLLPLAATA